MSTTFRCFFLLFITLGTLTAMADQPPAPAPAASEPKAADPFAFADFTWLNGNSRQKYALLDSKYFTAQFNLDANYVYDFNHPADHTLDGSCETGRTNEIQVQQLGVGGDFHYEHVHGRLMTQFGMDSTMTPRNDSSVARGQWDLANAYRYLSEANAGYHWDVWNGINLDAGIFMSYVGLFSYYNFENWAYQPSYVSANTPWFFNGLRLQMYPSDHFKAEVWLINGWQSYGMFNETPGIGTQLMWRPSGSLSLVSNDYFGYDTLGVPSRMRVHSDNSVQVKYHDRPEQLLDKAAFSVTMDAGCENGGGVTCGSQNFLGFMVYNRLWFLHDQLGLTVGGGAISNPGRYLVLLPPINGANAINYSSVGAPYFSQNPGDPFNAWDASITFDYMPDQFITFRFELDHRQADQNYFVGPGGLTAPSIPPPNGWVPDLVKSEDRINLAMMVRI